MEPAPPTLAEEPGEHAIRARWNSWLRAITGSRRWRNRPIGELLNIDRSVLVQALKIAISAGLSWALASWWFSSPSPIWAPITASLIALLTVQASIRDAVEKVFAVLIGIAVAILLAGLIGLHAWSIALIVAVGFLLGKMLRLSGGAAAQIPINGLFVLVLGNGSGLVTDRLLDTALGAGVAVIVNFAVIPPNYVASATRSVAAFADGVVDVLATMADGINTPWPLDDASSWLRSAREHGRFASIAESDVERATQSLQLHPGRSSWSGSLGRLTQTNDTLQIVELQVRTLARTLRDIATKLPSGSGRQPPMPMASGMLTATSDAIEAFAHTMLRAEKDTSAEVIGSAVHRSIGVARARITTINSDLGDMLAANLSRGVFLGALVVETGRILDELEAGLNAMNGSISELGETDS